MRFKRLSNQNEKNIDDHQLIKKTPSVVVAQEEGEEVARMPSKLSYIGELMKRIESLELNRNNKLTQLNDVNRTIVS